jgi:Myb/SANT-like DNA-binding domain
MAWSCKKKTTEGDTSDKEITTSLRCVWTDEDDAILVEVLTKQKRLGNSSDNGFKKTVWVAAAATLAAESPKNDPPKVASKCQDHWGNVSSSPTFCVPNS